ncbi:MAG: ribonuclease Y [Chlamydiae bacterium]|nr:ribonuclease Y [Chlamydiota bacterium]MBI3265702.1 ribonuclease Y [Chlamydiota bacterium]
MSVSEILKNHLPWAFLLTLTSGLWLGYALRSWLGRLRRGKAEKAAEEILQEAALQAQTRRKEAEVAAKEEFFKARSEFEKETKERRQEISNLEKRVIQKEEMLEKKLEGLDRKENDFRAKEKSLKTKDEEIEAKKKEWEALIEKEGLQLQDLSGLSRDEARHQLLSKIQEEVQHEAALAIRQAEARLQEEVDRKAGWMIVNAMQRCVMEHTQEATVTTVSLPNDDMKGKIIGRDGRNIRTFEAATGVDLTIDDTPETVVISAFDMVRREIARLSLEQLIRDGRIHPARIEEVVAKVKKEIEETIRQAGEKAVFELGLTALHPEVVKLVGRLKYRTSYGQNVLDHSKEVAWLMGVMASEMGMDVKLARRAGLLHDIGKALSHEEEGSHALIGGDLARKYGESPEVIAGIAEHHGETEEQTVWGIFTQVADAISAGRPGARSDTVGNYLQRLNQLEEIANSFPGVEKTYAIQAGRELRVMVKPGEVNDDAALLLSRNIAQKIQGSLQYPGVVKVTVIRETRAVEFAR